MKAADKNRLIIAGTVICAAVFLWLLFGGKKTVAVTASDDQPSGTMAVNTDPGFSIPGAVFNFDAGSSSLLFDPAGLSGVDFSLPVFGGFGSGGDVHILPPANSPGNMGGGNSNCNSCAKPIRAMPTGVVSYG